MALKGRHLRSIGKNVSEQASVLPAYSPTHLERFTHCKKPEVNWFTVMRNEDIKPDDLICTPRAAMAGHNWVSAFIIF